MNYIGAPYNFINLDRNILIRYENISDLPDHDKIYTDKLSGEIEYTIKNETPLFISNGAKKESDFELDFFRNVSGQYAIPGSSIRGLIRNNVQILGFGVVGGDIENKYMMYRCVGGIKSDLKDRYDTILGVDRISVNISVTKEVKAGYIKKVGEKYFIIPTKLEKNNSFAKTNYFPVREDYIEQEKNNHKDDKNPFEYLWKDNNNCKLQHIGEFKREEKKARNGKVIVHIKGKENKNYKPDYFPVSYELYDNRKVTAIGKPNEYKYNGYIIMTGKMQEKKTIYVIPEADSEKEELLIPEIDILSFKNDFENKRNILGDNKDFFNLPQKDNELKPCFYINIHGRLYFGFTPYLRLFYDGCIYDGLPDKQKDDNIIDYTKAMFGFSNDKKRTNYKSRVYFKDAINTKNKGFEKEEEYILSSPKPTSYMDYIIQPENGINTYNSMFDNKNKKSGFRLRGVKQYWFKDVVRAEETDKKKVVSKIRAMKSGSKFNGKIIFKNLDEDELGLLLWSLKLNTNCKQNIGMAKPYGYGRIEIIVDNLKVYDYSKMYNLDLLNFDVFESKEADVFIDLYKNRASKVLGKKIDNIYRIKDFIFMKTHIFKENADMKPDMVRYMKIENIVNGKKVNEFQNRTHALPTVSKYSKYVKSLKEKSVNLDNNKANKKKSNELKDFKDLKNFKF